jgi:hypothetical protein
MKSETTALTVFERASLALGAAGHEGRLKELAKQSEMIVAVTNPDSYQELHTARMTLKNERIAITKQGKEARDDASKFAKAVIVEEARLISLIEPEERRLQAIQDAHDAIVEEQKKAAAAAEANRIAAIQAQIAKIQSTPGLVAGKTALLINEQLVAMRGYADPDTWADEFAPIAKGAISTATVTLEMMHTGAVAAEAAKAAEEAKMKAEREELAKLRAEQEERTKAEILERARQKVEKDAADRKEAEERAERDKQARIATDNENRRIREEQEEISKKLREQAETLAKQQKAIDEALAKTAIAEVKSDAAKANFDIRARIDDALDRLSADDLMLVLSYVKSFQQKAA